MSPANCIPITFISRRSFRGKRDRNYRHRFAAVLNQALFLSFHLSIGKLPSALKFINAPRVKLFPRRDLCTNGTFCLYELEDFQLHEQGFLPVQFETL